MTARTFPATFVEGELEQEWRDGQLPRPRVGLREPGRAGGQTERNGS